MNLELAKLYNTPGQKVAAAAQAEDLEKAAQVELFAKLAADNNIDLSTLSDDQVSSLWNDTFGTKLAEEDNKEEKKEEKAETEAKREGESVEHEKEEQAKKAAAEFEAIQQQQKLAEADMAGRVMAHAMVQELNSINEAVAKEAAAKEASEKEAGAGQAAKNIAQYAAHKGKEMAHKAKEVAGKHPMATGAVAGAAGAHAAHVVKGKRKEASAIETLAIDRALGMAAEQGYNIEEVGAKLAASLENGIDDSAKVANASDVAQAVEIRALEFLEGAGYPVSWS